MPHTASVHPLPRFSVTPPNKPLAIKRIKRAASLSAQVTTQLEKFIVEQRLGEGARLPTERELAEKFEVSRTVVREAVRSLVANGMLVVNPGSGTLIKRPSAANMTQTMAHFLRLGVGGIDHDQITEVRRVLEVEIAGLAAERRTAANLEKLRQILADFERSTGDKAGFSAWDVRFHLEVATATQNELLPLLLDSISGIMTKVREIGFSVPGARENALRHHTAIYQQIEHGSAAGAREAMYKHITESKDTMAKGVTGTDAASGPPANPSR